MRQPHKRSAISKRWRLRIELRDSKFQRFLNSLSVLHHGGFFPFCHLDYYTQSQWIAIVSVEYKNHQRIIFNLINVFFGTYFIYTQTKNDKYTQLYLSKCNLISCSPKSFNLPEQRQLSPLSSKVVTKLNDVSFIHHGLCLSGFKWIGIRVKALL